MYLLLLFTIFAFGEVTSPFILTFGGESDDVGSSVIETSDGGFVVAGTSFQHNQDFCDIMISKFKFEGDDSDSHLWTTILGGSSADVALSIQETNDQGIIIAGYTKSFAEVNTTADALLTKLNSSGGHLWSKIVGTAEEGDFATSVLEESDGSLIVSGFTSSFSDKEGFFSGFVSKFNSTGGLIWIKTVGGEDIDSFSSSQLTSDGGFVLAGETLSVGASFNVLLSKFDGDGENLLNIVYGGAGVDRAYDVKETPDEGIVVVGISDSFGDSLDVLITKFNVSGLVSWNAVYGSDNDDVAYSVVINNFDGFVVVGETGNGTDDSDCFFSNFDENGYHVWTTTWGGELDDKVFAISRTLDDGYIIAGSSNSFGGSKDVFLSKFNSYTDFEFCQSCQRSFLYYERYIMYGDGFSITYNPPAIVTKDLTLNFTTQYIYPNVTMVSGDAVEVRFDLYACFTFISTDNMTCSGHGTCERMDVCNCDEGYFGKECSITTCDGVFSNITDPSLICRGRGSCAALDTCECTGEYYSSSTSSFCDDWDCFGVHYLENQTGSVSDVCYGHGSCISPDTCVCEQLGYFSNYSGDQCEIWSCGDHSRNSEFVCNSHGDCVNTNNCTCWNPELYTGYLCEYWKCHGVSNTMKDEVCASHGYCVAASDCECLSGYESLTYQGDCTEYKCGVYSKDSPDVCNGRGECISLDICSCLDFYFGDECEEWSCGGIVYFSASTCSSHGVCESPSVCSCNRGYSGELCDVNVLAISIGVPLAVMGVGTVFSGIVCCLLTIGFLLCLLMFCGCCMCTLLMCLLCVFSSQQSFKIKRFARLKNFDILLKEQQLEEDESIAHIRIDRSLFEIPMEELQLKRILGEGGSSSTVYLALWKGKEVAFKCFKTRVVCSDQESFDEFEREIAVLGSISHPHVIQCFGCSMKPPRVGIVMEFCVNGDLRVFLSKFKIVNKVSYNMKQKIRLLMEISASMEYIHSRNIIHRDLKLENVLLDEKESCKLMDFGLSKIVDRMSQKKTKRIGTSYYMAPEITLGEGGYDMKVDVFSFGMMMWIVATEMYSPFGEDETMSVNVEMKIANNPNFRPDSMSIFRSSNNNNKSKRVSVSEIVYGDSNQTMVSLKWFEKMMRKCWDHDPEVRPDFKSIHEVFQERCSSDVDVDDDEDEDEYVEREEEEEGEKSKILSDSTSWEDMYLESQKEISNLKSEVLKWKNMFTELNKKE